MQQQFHVIPAQPGYFFVVPVYDGDDLVDTHLVPIVGWQVELNKAVDEPSTPKGIGLEGGIDYPVLCPDGRVTEQESRSWWHSLAEYRKAHKVPL